MAAAPRTVPLGGGLDGQQIVSCQSPAEGEEGEILKRLLVVVGC